MDNVKISTDQFENKKGSKIYLFIRGWPQNGALALPSLKNKVQSAKCLIDQSTNLAIKQGGDTTFIDLLPKAPDHPITVVSLQSEGAVKVDPPVVSEDSTRKLELNYQTAVTHGNPKNRFNRKGGFYISKWTAPEDLVNWVMDAKKTGTFKVLISYLAIEESEDNSYQITIGNSALKPIVVYTGTLFAYNEFPLGYIDIPKAGNIF
jgi:hypothetical protein